MYVFDFMRAEKLPSGTICRVYRGCLHPEKGFPDPDFVYACGIVKKYLMSVVMTLAMREMALPILAFAVLPWKRKMRVVENALVRFDAFSFPLLEDGFMRHEYLTPCAKEAKTFVTAFFKSLGMSWELSASTGKAFSSLIEYDDAYRYRIQDIACEFSKEEIMRDPRAAIRKAAGIVMRRDSMVPEKFMAFAKLIELALLHPRIKSAFLKAMEATWFDQVKADEADKYFCMLKGGYAYGGMSEPDRLAKWEEVHAECGLPPLREVIM